MDRAISVFGYYPYFCRGCQLHFRSLRNTPVPEAWVHGAVEHEIRATREAMKSRRKRREWLLYSAAVVLFLAFLYYLTRDRGGQVEGGFAAPVPAEVDAGKALAERQFEI